jgi:hypothetical protein
MMLCYMQNTHGRKSVGSANCAYPHLKDCIGTLDGTHVRVSLYPSEQVRHIGKTGIPTQNILEICDFDMRFTCVRGVAGINV